MSLSSAAAIEVRDLRKSYRRGWFRRKFEALRGVSLQVERGEIFGLLGPNGAGKTTLVKILLGVITRTSGEARLLGRPAGDRDSRIRVGYLPENLRIAPHHTAWTAMEYYGRLSGLPGPVIRQRRPELLTQVGLMGRERESIRRFSKGMLQRLGLAQALLHDPELLILDEPTDGLDPLGRSQVRSVLQNLKATGKTIFLNSHILQEVELICDRVAIVAHGQVRAMGTVEQIAPRRSEDLELEVTLAGTHEAVRAAFHPQPITTWETSEHGLHHLTVRLASQADVDTCIDRLRQRGISIVNLVRRKMSLEDAFLDLLSEARPDQPPTAQSAPWVEVLPDPSGA